GLLRDSEARERLPGYAGRRVQARSQPVDHRNRDQAGQLPPFLPAMETAQVVRAHDPDTAHARTTLCEVSDSVVGVVRTDRGLETAHVDARGMSKRPGGGDSLGERTQTSRVLEWIARRYQPPQAVEIEPPDRDEAGGAVRGVRWIERAAE